MHWLIVLIGLVIVFVLALVVTATLAGYDARDLVQLPASESMVGASGNGNIISTQVNQNKKVIALLQLTGDNAVIDMPVAVSLQYIANLNGFPIDIVDVSSIPGKSLQLLDTLYNNGYRIFIGFNQCSEVSIVLDWFDSHRDTLAITLVNNCSDTQVIGKNVMRLSVNNRFISYYTSQFAIINGFTDVWLITSTNRTTNTEMRDDITQYLQASGKVNQVHQVNVNDINTDVQSRNVITQIFPTIPSTSLVVLLIQEDISYLLDYEMQSLQGTSITDASQLPSQFFPFDITLHFTVQQSQLFNGKFYQMLQDDEQDTTNIELASILGDNFNVDAYDAYNIARIANSLTNISDIYSITDHLLGHNGVLTLNNYNDQKFAEYVINKWDGKWDALWFAGNVPNDGLYMSQILMVQQEI